MWKEANNMLMIDKVRELVNAKIKKYKSRLRAAEKRRESGVKHIAEIGNAGDKALLASDGIWD